METAQSIKLPVGMIVGPTASGKTALSVELAKRLDAEIVSADSIQIYKELDIGSAKPSLAERQGIPHHLIDFVDISDANFSVAEYQKLAASAIEDIAARGKFPIVAGGTGLYINSLTYPLSFTEIPGDKELRATLESLEAREPGSLRLRLQKADPVTAERLHPNDKKRIVRAIEVYELTGKPLSEHGNDFSNSDCKPIPYNPRMIGIDMPREKLYERIERRVDEMMAQGLLDEVCALKKSGCLAEWPSMQGLGYKQLLCYLNGDCDLYEAVERIKRETRHFAKRQLTWFKRDKRIHWLDFTGGDHDIVFERALRILRGEED